MFRAYISDLPEIRLYFIDDSVDELLGNTALPRYQIFDPWRVNCPQGDERLARNATDVPYVGVHRNRVAVLLDRDSDRKELLVAERIRTVVDDQSRTLALLTQFERIRMV